MEEDLAHTLAATSFALSDLGRDLKDLGGRGVLVPAEITQAVADIREWLDGVSG